MNIKQTHIILDTTCTQFTSMIKNKDRYNRYHLNYMDKKYERYIQVIDIIHV